jgi:hypothetical protein
MTKVSARLEDDNPQMWGAATAFSPFDWLVNKNGLIAVILPGDKIFFPESEQVKDTADPTVHFRRLSSVEIIGHDKQYKVQP